MQPQSRQVDVATDTPIAEEAVVQQELVPTPDPIPQSCVPQKLLDITRQSKSKREKPIWVIEKKKDTDISEC